MFENFGYLKSNAMAEIEEFATFELGPLNPPKVKGDIFLGPWSSLSLSSGGLSSAISISEGKDLTDCINCCVLGIMFKSSHNSLISSPVVVYFSFY